MIELTNLHRGEFEIEIQTLLDEHENEDFTVFKKKCLEKGLNLDEVRLFNEKGVAVNFFTIDSYEQFENDYLNISDFKEGLLQQFCNEKITPMISAEKCKALISAKHDVEKSFLDFKLSKIKVLFGSLSLSIVLIIVLKVLALTGISALAGSLVPLTGGLILIPVIIFIILGLVMLKQAKPSLLKISPKIQLQLILPQIASTYYEIKQRRAKANVLKTTSLIQDLAPLSSVGTTYWTKDVLPQLKTLQRVNQKLNKWKDKIDLLHLEFNTAGYNDFINSLNLQPRKFEEQIIIYKQKTDLELIEEMKKCQLTEEEFETLELLKNSLISKNKLVLGTEKRKKLQIILKNQGYDPLKKETMTKSFQIYDPAETIIDALIKGNQSAIDKQTLDLFKTYGIDLTYIMKYYKNYDKEQQAKIKIELINHLKIYFGKNDSEMLKLFKEQQVQERI